MDRSINTATHWRLASTTVVECDTLVDAGEDELMRFGKLMVALALGLSIQPSSNAKEKAQLPGNSIARIPPRQNPDYPVTQPAYPAEGLASGFEGEVILGFYVRADGSIDPQTITVEKSTGLPVFDASAVKEAASWRFLPATENGQPIGSHHQFRVIFFLKDGNLGKEILAEEYPKAVEQGPDQHDLPAPLNIGD